MKMASETETDSPISTNRLVPEDVLEDLCSRFLINIPDEERQEVVRLCFQIELAHWFYIDFYRQENPDLPGCGIKEFTRIVFNKFPFLNKTGESVDQIFADWRKYKHKVPVFGAILINQTFDKCLLVQPARSKTSWGFPKGKVNKDEDEFECAIREVYEETGFDMRDFADRENYIEHKIHDHPIRLYVAPGVPEGTPFQPQTRGEIGDIRWFEIEYLPTHRKDTNCTEYFGFNPNSFFMVIPFVKDLRKRMSCSLPSRSSSHNSRTSNDDMSSPKIQLQKLVDKEEARLEKERKQAALEKRRKLQQERFMAQHAMSHPLREHHHKDQERLRAARGYQSPVNERDSAYLRGSPIAREPDEKTPSPIKILQRSERSSPRDHSLSHGRSSPHDRKTNSKNQSSNSLPFRQLFGENVDRGRDSFEVFSPIHQAGISPYGTYPMTGSSPGHPTTPYGVNMWQQESAVEEMDPLLKLRLLSANASSVHSPMLNTSLQENTPHSNERFLFSAPAFEKFKFNRQVFMDILKDTF